MTISQSDTAGNCATILPLSSPDPAFYENDSELLEAEDTYNRLEKAACQDRAVFAKDSSKRATCAPNEARV